MTPVGDPATPPLTCLSHRTTCPSFWRPQYLRALEVEQEVEQEDRGRERRRRSGQDTGFWFRGTGIHWCTQAWHGSCHASSLRLPGLCPGLAGSAPFSSLLRTLFVYLKQGRSGDPSRYVFWAGRAGMCVTSAQTHTV